MATNHSNTQAAGVRRGELVEVRSLSEILATLDADCKLEGLPFMPEMAPHCGRRFRVYRRAEKTCVEGIGIQRMRNTVFLEGLRCDGAMHDGCQRQCLMFWKEAWLRRVAAESDAMPGDSSSPDGSAAATAALPTRKDDRYFCQSTELLGATSPLSRLNLRAYLRDLRLGEATPWLLARVLGRALFNKFRRLVGHAPYGQLLGTQAKAPRGNLDLQPGELVEVKSRQEIEATLDADGRNCGLSFEVEMLEHCGRRYRVAYPIRKIIFEQTSKMVQLNNTVALEGVVCQGLCAKNCPRANYLYWRESWLRRVEA
jgi:hypothetical protein